MTWTLCLNTSTIKPQALLEKVRLTAEAGFQGVELWANDIYEFVGQGGEVRDLQTAIADHGLIVPCMIAVRSWGEASELEYPLMLDEVKRRMELANRLNSPWIVATPPRDPCPTDQLIARYRDLLELGRKTGVKPTFEYISFFGSVSKLEQAWQIVTEVDDDDATVIVDAFHTWNSGSRASLLAEIPASRVGHYHIDDAAPHLPAGQQTDPDRVMLGEGPIDLKAELAMLKQIGYEGTISLELFNRELWEQDPATVLKTGFERLTELCEEA